ncbi:LLM class flavin-dependent oxidoreductase [Micromonospora inositola]|uniref:LLM class flavin-dependent oxidoreductase n=1 Tax=Micromonospora inositola TaxID=47865 RepID=UPI000B5B0164
MILGWSDEEYQATGASRHRPGQRAAEFVEVLRTLWQDDVATHSGEFYRIPSTRGAEAGAATAPADPAPRPRRYADGRRLRRRLPPAPWRALPDKADRSAGYVDLPSRQQRRQQPVRIHRDPERQRWTSVRGDARRGTTED